MDLRQYLTALRMRWPLILLLTLVGALGGYGLAKTTPVSYTASAKVFVSPSTGQTPSELVQASTFIKNIVESYTSLVDMPVVLDPVISDLKLDTNARTLAGAIATDSPINTSIIEIRVSQPDPRRASAIANSVAHQLSLTVAELTPSPAEKQTVKVTVVSPATIPNFPSAPRLQLYLAAGLAGGLAAGMILALILSMLDTRIRDSQDVEFLHDEYPVLGRVPYQPARRYNPLALLVDPVSPWSEGFRRLHTNLSFLDASRSLDVIVVTSSLAGEGKTSTAVSLALSLGEGNRRILLVDADLRRPGVALAAGLEGGVGLTNVLIGQVRLEEVVQKVGPVDVLAAGAIPPNPHQLLESAAMADLVASWRSRYDMVVIDAPPTLAVSDAAVLSRMSDGALVVVNCRGTRRKDLTQALRELRQGGATCLGLVLSSAPPVAAKDEYYGQPVARPRRFPWNGRLLRGGRSSTHRGTSTSNRLPEVPAAEDQRHADDVLAPEGRSAR